MPHCRDGKTEAGEGRPLPTPRSPVGALPATRAPRKRGGHKYFLEDGKKPSPRRGKWILRKGRKEGLSADRRLVICKKFISTFKKEREPEEPGCPDGG